MLFSKKMENRFLWYEHECRSTILYVRVCFLHTSVFRQCYCCQYALFGLLKNWRKYPLAKKKIGALLMDLIKAFDCMSHELLVSKLAYGVQPKSSKKIKQSISKGVLQGSVHGHMLFYVFIVNLFHCVKNVLLTNCADDNTLSYAIKQFLIVKL